MRLASVLGFSVLGLMMFVAACASGDDSTDQRLGSISIITFDGWSRSEKWEIQANDQVSHTIEGQGLFRNMQKVGRIDGIYTQAITIISNINLDELKGECSATPINQKVYATDSYQTEIIIFENENSNRIRISQGCGRNGTENPNYNEDFEVPTVNFDAIAFALIKLIEGR